MIFFLGTLAIVAVMVFFIAWRGFDTQIGAAITVAVVGSGALAITAYILVYLPRL